MGSGTDSNCPPRPTISSNRRRSLPKPLSSIGHEQRTTRLSWWRAPASLADSMPAMGRIDDRLRELGITLPAPRAPLANYVPARRVGNLVYTAGQISGTAEREIKGKLGADMSVE